LNFKVGQKVLKDVDQKAKRHATENCSKTSRQDAELKDWKRCYWHQQQLKLWWATYSTNFSKKCAPNVC